MQRIVRHLAAGAMIAAAAALLIHSGATHTGSHSDSPHVCAVCKTDVAETSLSTPSDSPRFLVAGPVLLPTGPRVRTRNLPAALSPRAPPVV